MPNKNYVALQIAADPLFNISKNFNMCRDYGVTPRPKVSSKKMTKKSIGFHLVNVMKLFRRQ